MGKINKWKTMSIIQQNCGFGWDDIQFANYDDEEDMRDLKADLKSCRENQHESLFRVIHRDIINDEWFKNQYPQFSTLQNSREYIEICSNSGVTSNYRLNQLLVSLQEKLEFYERKGE